MQHREENQQVGEEKEKLGLNLAQIAGMLADEAIGAASLPLSLAFNFALSLLRSHFAVDTEEVPIEDSSGMDQKRIAFKALNRICLVMLQAKDVSLSSH